EDGIRDFHVTGVQTCALPILNLNGYGDLVTYGESTFDYGSIRKVARDHNVWGLVAALVLTDKRDIRHVVRTFHRDSVVGGINSRSEERRVGKECGLRRAT